MTLPSIVIVPFCGFSNPEMTRSVVVLPQPDGPSSVMKSPSSIVRLMSRRTWLSP